MESLLSGFQMPLQRRLTKMYTDTKSSYDFVKDPVQTAEIPELSSLHRKLRIQKDRLVSWGLGWSDPTESPDIDESLSKAGISDVVGSVMSTIKDILAEAEPLWQSSKRISEPPRGSEKSGDQKLSLVVWDRSRFEDLVRDLTSSIDTLYDLSSTRKTGRPSLKHGSPSGSFQAKLAAAEAERKFESTRILTPQQIDPTTLITDPTDPKSTLLYSSLAGTFPVGLAGSRQIVYIRRQPSSNNPWQHGGPPIAPVLLEYAPYDPIFANTGVVPSMNRFEKLFAGLQMSQGPGGRSEFGVLNLIGYFEEPLQSHFGLLYELPNRFSPEVDVPGTPVMPYAATLGDLLSDQMFEPALETKFRLACNVAMTVFDLHSKGIIHGNISASNVVFFDKQSTKTTGEDALSKINVRQAFLTSFDLFPDYAGRQEASDVDSSEIFLYRSPIDPRVTNLTVLSHESRSLDVYSLAMLLLEIGLWTPLRDIFPPHLGIPSDTTSVYKQVAARCGTKYLTAVKACWRAVDEELSSVSRPEVALQKIYGQVVQALESCCMIEEGPEQEELIEVNTRFPIIPEMNHSTKGSEATAPNVTARWPKLNEQQRAIDVLSNVIKARDAHYRKKNSTPSLATPSVQSQVEKDASHQTILSIPVAESLYPSEKKNLQILEKQSETPSMSMESMDLQALKLIMFIDTQEVKEPPSQKAKMKIFRSIKVGQEHLDYWHRVLMQEINHALRGFYRKYPESVEISLESIGENVQAVKPTILVVCTSVGKVKSILKRSFVYDSSTYGLLVCKGKILRSRKDNPKRSMAGEGVSSLITPLNKAYQERPLNGASIGAYIDGVPLPPVSFGGVLMIDDKPYGLTVHHMLDDPEDADDDTYNSQPPTLRSSDHILHLRESDGKSQHEESLEYDDFDCEISESGSDASSIFSNFSEEDDQVDEDYGQQAEPGDIEGIPQGCGAGYHVTQPAIDDVDLDIFPSEDAAEEDFLDSFKLGQIYASSGLRRRYEQGVAHEIDWALFEFEEERLPPGNHIKDGAKHCRSKSPYPVKIAPWSKLHDLEVHCMARTTGLQTGHILPGMSVVKIFGRQTPSQSYQVSGRLGVPGDSGAWLIDNQEGRACGHVLAWSSRKKVAYICPMEILLSDIAETLDARTVCFPSASVVRIDTLNEAETQDGSSTGHISALDENPPTPQPNEAIQGGALKSPISVRYANPGDDTIVAAMDAMQIINKDVMLSTQSLRQNHLSRARRSQSLDGGHSSYSSAEGKQQNELPTGEGNLGSPVRGMAANRRHLSKSVDARASNPDLHTDFLELLKRRSLPHAPQRSSSLTAPPAVPPEDGSAISPITSITTRKRGHNEAFPPSSRGWREWLAGIIDRWHESGVPQRRYNTSSPSRNDATREGDQSIIDPSDSMVSSEVRGPSSRYVTPVSFLWILRQCPNWYPAVHPVVYGFRYLQQWRGNEQDTLLDIGCEILGGPSLFGIRVGEPMPSRIGEAEEEDMRVPSEDIDATSRHASGSSCDGECCVEQIENAWLATTTDEQPGNALTGNTDGNDSSDRETITSMPRTPRPANRSLSFMSNAMYSTVRLNEIVTRAKTQELIHAAMLLEIRIERRFGSTLQPENAISSDDDADEEIIGEGNLTIPAAMGGSFQDSVFGEA